MTTLHRQLTVLITALAGLLLAAPGYATATQQNIDSSLIYKEECASCHMAYPPMLLPARSWQKLMTGLDNHFGENAALDAATAQTISQYLQRHSADAGYTEMSDEILEYLPRDSTPIRISTLPAIRHEHDELPARLIASNPQVGRLSNCSACHQGAEQGEFDDDHVQIPGYGRWDD